MERYADYVYYTETYGGSMPKVSFNQLSMRMSRWIDKITFGRLRTLAEAPEWLKFACCELCEKQFAHDSAKTDGKNVKSVNNDGYSVTFSDDSTSDVAHERALSDIANLYIPVEYRSFCMNEDLEG